MSPLERDARCVTDSIRRTNDARVDYPASTPLATPRDTEFAIYVDGFGFVDRRAVRAIERALGITTGAAA